jgi:polar amino acid transport system substrate-binding protein
MDKGGALFYAAYMKHPPLRCTQLLTAAVLLCVSQVFAADTLMHTSVESDADLEWSDDGASGLCPDIFKAIEKRDHSLKFSWTKTARPERRLMSELAIGDLDVACGFVRTPEREQQFQVPDVVLYEKTLIAVVRNGDPLDLNILSDLKKLAPADVVLVNSGAQMAGRLRQIGIGNIDDGGRRTEDNLQKLILGRGRVFLYDDPAIDWDAHHPAVSGKLHAIPAALDVDRHYMFLSRKLQPDVIKRITAILTQLRNDGTLRDLAEKWSTRVELAKPASLRAALTQG